MFGLVRFIVIYITLSLFASTYASESNSEFKEEITRDNDSQDNNFYFSENNEHWLLGYSNLFGTGISVFSIGLLSGGYFGYIKKPTLSWSFLVYSGHILKKLLYYKILEVSNSAICSHLESAIAEETKEYLADHPKLEQVTKFVVHTSLFFVLDTAAKKSMDKYVLGFFMRFIPSEPSSTIIDMTQLSHVETSWSLEVSENLRKLQSLMDRITSKEIIKVFSNDGLELVEGKSFEKVGAGGSKTFYKVIENEALKNTVLAIPNFTDIRIMAKAWLRIVSEETRWTQLIERAGIPVPDSKARVLQFVKDGFTYSVPTYSSTDFNSFSDAFVLEGYLSNDKTPDWIKPLREMDLSGYKKAFQSLWQDVCKLCMLGLDPNRDTKNFIIVNENNKWHSGGSSPIEVRAFLFDFTSKHRESPLPISPLTLDSEKRIFKDFVEKVIYSISPVNFKNKDDKDELIESIVASQDIVPGFFNILLSAMGGYILSCH